MTERSVIISAPKFETLEFHLVGTAPYVQLRFSEKARQQMRDKQEAGSTARKGKTRTARDFAADYESATYRAQEGWYGIPASSFRNAAIDACRLVNFKMTLAKLSIFVQADGLDPRDGIPLVRIEGEPQQVEHMVRNETGVSDIRVRAMWQTWKATVRVQYDADQFSATDVANLMARVGMQVGIGEGRPNGHKGNGMGWGLFKFAD